MSLCENRSNRITVQYTPVGEESGLDVSVTVNLPGMAIWRYSAAARQSGSNDESPHWPGQICRAGRDEEAVVDMYVRQ